MFTLKWKMNKVAINSLNFVLHNAHVLATATSARERERASKQQNIWSVSLAESFFILINWFIARCRCRNRLTSLVVVVVCLTLPSPHRKKHRNVLTLLSLVVSLLTSCSPSLRFYFTIQLDSLSVRATCCWQILDKFINKGILLSVKILALWWWMFI